MDSLKRAFETLTALLSAPVYLVGGAVRDIVLGRKPKDLDFATPLPAEEVAKRLRSKGFPVSEAGIAYGVVTTLFSFATSLFAKHNFREGKGRPGPPKGVPRG